MEKEIWKDVVGYEGHYMVSSLGGVKSVKFKKERNLKKIRMNNGYLASNLCKKGIQRIKPIHQLVAESFLKHRSIDYKLVINHINFNKSDNRLSNLEIVTPRENTNKKHIKSSSKYTGVYWHKENEKWVSRIVINKKTKYLGSFTKELCAHKAYQKALSEIT